MVSSTPRPHFTPGKDPVPILQEAEWAPGPVWTGGKSRPLRDSIPDRPARSQSLYRLSYPALIIQLSPEITLQANSEPGEVTLVAVSRDSFPYKRYVEIERVVTDSRVFVRTENIQNVK